jgi:hypothetical protein
MEEAKQRLSAIDTLINGGTGLPEGAAYECCFLQLRMICEVISLGCLTAHGDIAATSKLRKRYEADKIIKELAKLHPHFYPKALSQWKSGEEMPETTILMDGFLTKRELIRLYAKCGGILHRGSKETMFGPLNVDFATVLGLQRKIATLLKYHAIFLLDNKSIVFFTLGNPQKNEKVQWILTESEAALSLVIGLATVSLAIFSWPPRRLPVLGTCTNIETRAMLKLVANGYAPTWLIAVLSGIGSVF